jgi:hypothetical protein
VRRNYRWSSSWRQARKKPNTRQNFRNKMISFWR